MVLISFTVNPFKIKEFQIPLTITRDHTEILLVLGKSDKPPSHMYC